MATKPKITTPTETDLIVTEPPAVPAGLLAARALLAAPPPSWPERLEIPFNGRDRQTLHALLAKLKAEGATVRIHRGSILTDTPVVSCTDVLRWLLQREREGLTP